MTTKFFSHLLIHSLILEKTRK